MLFNVREDIPIKQDGYTLTTEKYRCLCESIPVKYPRNPPFQALRRIRNRLCLVYVGAHGKVLTVHLIAPDGNDTEPVCRTGGIFKFFFPELCLF